MSDIEKDFEIEFSLAQCMKDTCCDESGKETNPAKAAEILHQIGLIYRKRSPDKISLIKSAGLLNAAIVRIPPNVSQIKSDLSDLCRHILRVANAKKQNVDLVEKSKEIKTAIEKLRNVVTRFLEANVPKDPNSSKRKALEQLKLQKVSGIQEINTTIAHTYKHIMKNLSKFCEKIMGKPPCQYAIVGMGSLAREEITPYSDFEHIILLFDDKNYKSYLKYFKWFSVIFHIVVLNVQETIVPSLNITSLNGNESSLGDWFYDDVTPRGISFDGMMPHACKFPLGRQQHTKNKQFTTELIKPVSEMLEYLSSEADLKNGYHLADILTKTCFVFGNEDIFKQFTDGAQNYLDTKSQTDTINDIKQQVKQDLNSFSTRFRLSNLKSQHTINIKQLVYRSTTIFISALARKHNASISASSCFNIIDQMAKNNQITQNTAEKLKFAIAIACEMRLRVYMDKNSQCDNAIDLQQDGMETFLDIVGVACTINYFQIAYCLQCEVAKQLSFTKLHFYTNSQLVNITIGLAFKIKDLTSFSKELQKQTWDSSKFDFDECIKQLESEMTLNFEKFKTFGPKVLQNMFFFLRKTFSSSSSQTDVNLQQIKLVANYLISSRIFDEASEFYKQMLYIYESKSKNTNRDYDVAWASHQIGYCLLYANEPAQALSYLRRSLEIKENLSKGVERARDVVATLNNIGWCHIDLRNYNEALTILNRAIEIKQYPNQNAETDRHVATTFHNIGWCHIRLHNYDEALTNLNRALKIKQNTSIDADKDRSLAGTLYNIGRCLTGLQQYDDSWNCLQQSLKIFQNTTLDENKDIGIAHTICSMGECLMGKQQFAEALDYLQKSREIYQTHIFWEKDPGFAWALHHIGICLMKLQKYADALNSLRESLEIYEKLPLSQELTSKIESIRYNIDECSLKLR